MKKTVLIILIAAVVIAACLYLMIPSRLIITNQVSIEASDMIASKFLTGKNSWDKWWPGKKTGDKKFTFNGLQFYINNTTNSGVNLSLQKGNLKLRGNISYLASGDNVVKITWYAEKKNNLNPIQRIADNKQAADVENQINLVLIRLKTFLEDEKNAYGYKIYISKVKDPVLLTTTTGVKSYPDMGTVYTMINKLKQQAAAQGAKVTNYPMLNLHKMDNNQYQLGLAVPISKKINPVDGAFINNMVNGGNLLVADVKGGPNTINGAFGQVKIFMKDHGLISPAMPFESLITDRSAEKDTSKWVTKIYYPIF